MILNKVLQKRRLLKINHFINYFLNLQIRVIPTMIIIYYYQDHSYQQMIIVLMLNQHSFLNDAIKLYLHNVTNKLFYYLKYLKIILFFKMRDYLKTYLLHEMFNIFLIINSLNQRIIQFDYQYLMLAILILIYHFLQLNLNLHANK